jgi:hypothetical protein
MVKIATPADVAIHWVRERPDCPAAEPACTSTVRTEPDFSACRITALESVPDDHLGHQFRHCFGFAHADTGYRHPSYSTARHNFADDMVKVAAPKSVRVLWRREQPTTETCGNSRLPGRVPDACANVAQDHSSCRITAHEWATEALLGHELRHCFGWKHAADVLWRANQKPKP